MNIFNKYESEVRYYSRNFPKIFTNAKMSKLYTNDGTEYIDFFSGAGALNFGSNNDYIIDPMIEYLKKDGIIHGLDFMTIAKKKFIKSFVDNILIPRDLNYKIMFCGPTGTNANEAALKIARKAKARHNIISFSGAFHGMSLGSISLTSSIYDRNAAGVPLSNVTFMPYPFGIGETFDTIEYLQNVLNDDHSGVEKPAAIFLETVQAEGGVIVSNEKWLRRLDRLCKENDILLIIDDIQVGCGRTGNFFSFERAGIKPDIITLSKSISGCGLPMSMVLLSPHLDCLKPGEHNGTFRGNQLAFITGNAAIDYFIKYDLSSKTCKAEKIVKQYYEKEISPLNYKLVHRGIGLIHGIDFNNITTDMSLAKMVSEECFKRGLVIECSGRNNNVLKLLPPLVIENNNLILGLDIIKESIKIVLEKYMSEKNTYKINYII